MKVVLCGQGGVGKTALARAFTGSESGRPGLTVGADFYAVTIDGVKFVVWDIGGEERFRFIAPAALRGADAVIYVFDLTRPGTLDALREWVDLGVEVLGRHRAVLVGNKSDLERRVERSAAEEFAREAGMVGYVEASAALLVNVDAPFLLAAGMMSGSPRHREGDFDGKRGKRKEEGRGEKLSGDQGPRGGEV